MALNIYLGVSKASLEATLATLRRDKDSLVVSTSAGDSSMSKHKDVTQIERRIEQVLHALYLLDPETYPYDQTHRTTQTKVYFSSTLT